MGAGGVLGCRAKGAQQISGCRAWWDGDRGVEASFGVQVSPGLQSWGWYWVADPLSPPRNPHETACTQEGGPPNWDVSAPLNPALAMAAPQPSSIIVLDDEDEGVPEIPHAPASTSTARPESSQPNGGPPSSPGPPQSGGKAGGSYKAENERLFNEVRLGPVFWGGGPSLECHPPHLGATLISG